MTAPSLAARMATRRMFGHYELQQVLGRSSLTMTWLAVDTHTGQAVILAMPRAQPADGGPLKDWQAGVRRASRVRHPNLAAVIDTGVQDRWPYVVYARDEAITLAEAMSTPRAAMTPIEVVDTWLPTLEGLAFAHESGVIHGDLQAHHVLVGEGGRVSLIGLEVALSETPPGAQLSNGALQWQRQRSANDLLSCGLVLHRMLAGIAPLDEADTSLVMPRLAPMGRELARLPWSTPHPIPEALRAIANRATDRLPQHRYFTARTLLRALQGWREAASRDDGGALALMLDRLQSVGHLPARPDIQRRVAKVTDVDGQHARGIAAELLQDMSLSFELLRLVNTVEVRNAMMGGNGPVLTVRRAIALIGLQGVQRAANAVRPWPGPLNESQAQALQQVMDNARIAGMVAVRLRPAGYDPEVVFMVALLQNLGRLLVQYHFAEEAQQIRQLMLPVLATEDPSGAGEGMSEREASYAVLGIDTESIGTAVAKHWGLTDDVLNMVRRWPLERAVHAEGDHDKLRTAASAGNEALDALLAGDPPRVTKALVKVVQRYGRTVGFTGKELQEALQAARLAVRQGRIELEPEAATE